MIEENVRDFSNDRRNMKVRLSARKRDREKTKKRKEYGEILFLKK